MECFTDDNTVSMKLKEKKNVNQAGQYLIEVGTRGSIYGEQRVPSVICHQILFGPVENQLLIDLQHLGWATLICTVIWQALLAHYWLTPFLAFFNS